MTKPQDIIGPEFRPIRDCPSKPFSVLETEITGTASTIYKTAAEYFLSWEMFDDHLLESDFNDSFAKNLWVANITFALNLLGSYGDLTWNMAPSDHLPCSTGYCGPTYHDITLCALTGLLSSAVIQYKDVCSR
ncbi:hypothetical protein P879_01609 [Paragonimus westermani]|uniref:Uncharacterized protein n=1 Tax=Paragonimus westermani TaxID=34504 RepID=A0A8T0DBH3_9TREM|nr:hypothetical protein P879_01609 [Paragonimus westermani]